MHGKYDKGSILWLFGELPGLSKEKLLSDDAAENLKTHYRNKMAAGKERNRNILLMFLGLISVGLIGCGGSLIIAHNWDLFSPDVRLTMGFIPLIAGIILGFYSILSNRGQAWNEISALMTAAGIMTSIAVVSQVYHINGSFADYTKICLLLFIPLIYLFSSGTVLLLHVTGFYYLILNCLSENLFHRYSVQLVDSGLIYLLFMIPLPLIIYQLIRFPDTAKSVFYRALLIALVNGILLAGVVRGFAVESVITALIFYFSLFYAGYESKGVRLMKNPLLWYSLIALVCILGFYSYPHTREFPYTPLFFESVDTGIIVSRILTVLLLAGILFLSVCRRKPIYFFPYVAIAAVVSFHFYSQQSFILMQIIFAAAAFYSFILGERQEKLSALIFGMLLIALLTLQWFFAGQWDIVYRGIGFIFTGFLFAAATRICSKIFKRSRSGEIEGGLCK